MAKAQEVQTECAMPSKAYSHSTYVTHGHAQIQCIRGTYLGGKLQNYIPKSMDIGRARTGNIMQFVTTFQERWVLWQHPKERFDPVREVRGDAPKKVQMEPKSASRNELGEGGSETSKSRECACAESWWPKKTWPLKALRELLCPRREGRTQDEVPRRWEACAACQGFVFILTA